MKKRLKYSLWFFGCLLIIHGIGLAYYWDTPNPLAERIAIQEAKISNEQYVACGNSRAYYAVNDSLIKDVINTSSLGENSIYTYYQILHLLEEGHRPRAFLYPCANTDIYSLNDHFSNRDYAWREHINYTEIGWHKDKLFSEMGFHIKRKVFPYALLINWELESESNQVQAENPGHYARLTDAEREQHAIDMVSAYPEKLYFQSEVSLLYLEKTILLCKEYDVPLIGIKYPTTKEYRNAVAIHLAEAEIELKSDSILEAHNIWQIDMENHFEGMPEFFLDPHHLNTKGQDQFAPLLEMQLKRYQDIHLFGNFSQ